jgi:hypothetical protein
MKDFLIVFTDVHLAYSPTVLNLFYELKKYGKVKLIAPEPNAIYSSQKVDDDDIIYLKEEQPQYPGTIKRLFTKVKNRIDPQSSKEILFNQLKTPIAIKLIELINGFDGEIIAVDFFALWCVQQTKRRVHLISLEIHAQDRYRDACDLSLIKSVLIQSEVRYQHLFKEYKIKSFIIQNAPSYIDLKPDYNQRNNKSLIYCGSAVPWFGIITCIDFIKDFPEYTLTIKGAIPQNTFEVITQFYSDMLQEKKLILDNTYLDTNTLTEYVSQFRIGFAFYDFYRFDHVRTFNYFTAPSGKVFQYFNSGIPIIANDLPGFQMIKERKAGILISHLSSNIIKASIEKIEVDYGSFAENSKVLSQQFDFKQCARDYINFLINE